MSTIETKPTLETFAFSYGQSVIGTFLVALSPRGVVSILLGEDRSRLRAELADAFPSVSHIEDEAVCSRVVEEVEALIDAPSRAFTLPLDMRGTALEQAVWTSLRCIPAGETRTYGDVAKTLPIAATAQEVGAACAANVLAVAVPCHRVIKADGSVSGYRWGTPRKRRLISMERAA